MYRCDDFFQVFDLPLVSHTGVLNVFKLIYYPPGFILQFPRSENPKVTAEFKEQRRIFEVYQENRKLGRVLNVHNVGLLNQIILNNQISGFIQVAEVLHAKKIIKLANEVYNKKDRIRLVCIAGPSSSGKTTFSKRFAIQLRSLGLNPVTISVDNYFVDRDKTPLNKDGKPDYESIEALNLDLFNEHINMLLEGQEIKLPVYDFISGKSSEGDEKLSINEDDIIIIEGIHCLNDKLTYIVPKEKKFKIYVSVLTQMNIDNNNRIPTTDNRIIRRLIRDYRYRGHSALKTLQMWPYVREGEEKYIFPFQNYANGYFNSALDYELSLLRSYAEPILMQVKPYHKEYANAVRLLKFLSYFLPIPPKDVPSTSIIREFIGGSSFHY
jgi:uridine kinase